MALTISSSSSSRAKLGRAVADARARAGLSQVELAKLAGIRPGRVKRLEDGSAASAETLAAVLAALERRGAGEGLEPLRAALEVLEGRQDWKTKRGWELKPPAALRLRVLAPGGICLPSGQVAPAGAVLTLERPEREGWAVLAEAGHVQPVTAQDVEALAILTKRCRDVPWMAPGVPVKRPAPGWDGRWTRWPAGMSLGEGVRRASRSGRL